MFRGIQNIYVEGHEKYGVDAESCPKICYSILLIRACI